jgi:hypothetical protein
MKKRKCIFWAFFLTLFASFVFPVSAHAAIYYLSTNGNDNSPGSQASPWLSPNHAVSCGDTILAAPGLSYAASNFAGGKWGNVNCPAGNNVAWLKCATFGTCKVIGTGYDAIRVSASYWGVQGFEATNATGACFTATPTGSSMIHHIIFANNIANGCQNNGFSSYPFYAGTAPPSVDYLAIIGNLAYNAAGGNSYCFSGISVYEPRNFDTAPGTHVYIAQNISWSNNDGQYCPGNSDGEGIILDDWKGDQSGYTTGYSGQGVVENNLVLGNGSAGIEPFHNSVASIIIRNNTSYANNTDLHHAGTYLGEILISLSSFITVKYNIVHSIVATCCASHYPVFALYVGSSDNTNILDYNWVYSISGNNTGINASPGFSFGSHQTFGINPGFVNPLVPGAPNCSGTSSTLDCMKTTLANFVPSASGISGYGYQPVTGAYLSNSYYPSWLCNVTIPSGIISNYCLPTGSVPTPVPVIPGDLNGDGKVDFYDYNLFVGDYGKTGSPGFVPSDIDKNGKVDIFDYNLLVANYGK